MGTSITSPLAVSLKPDIVAPQVARPNSSRCHYLTLFPLVLERWKRKIIIRPSHKTIIEIKFKRKRNTSQLQWLKDFGILVIMTFWLTS